VRVCGSLMRVRASMRVCTQSLGRVVNPSPGMHEQGLTWCMYARQSFILIHCSSSDPRNSSFDGIRSYSTIPRRIN
jgi:hypothetical protein